MPAPGNFIPFLLRYKPQHNSQPGDLDSIQQAQAIIDKTRALLAAGAAGVAITYSANYNQTVAIHQVYTAGGWNTHTMGGNQATVMAEMERLMGLPENRDVQMKLRIAPISTMSYPTIFTHYQYVFLDLVNIKVGYLDQGWTVLGWQNQDVAPGEYAVGGSIAGKMPDEIRYLIQNVLKLYEKQYAPAPSS